MLQNSGLVKSEGAHARNPMLITSMSCCVTNVPRPCISSKFADLAGGIFTCSQPILCVCLHVERDFAAGGMQSVGTCRHPFFAIVETIICALPPTLDGPGLASE